jgi:uncharacterized lipoprotein YddW (UPF0748 family)
MKFTSRILFFLSFFIYAATSQAKQPKHEMRAVWVATVANIDWPSSKGLSVEEQKSEIISMLDAFKRDNINTVIFQARPSADAFYDSKTEPWSQWLTGVAGKAPEPFYDPLKFIISEAHKRAMELHVWVNPYRALNYSDVSKFAPNSVYHSHPEWFVKYGGKILFDPGLKETRDYLAAVIAELVVNYDLDAIVFDDYFYPYPVAKEKFDDSKSFAKDPRGFTSLADWRRDNVNLAIAQISDTIHALKPWVQFGISPFGVWRHQADDPRGSETSRALTNYDNLYADVLNWVDNDLLDYVSPQLYWEIGKSNVDYAKLLPWWSKNSGKANLYVSMYSSGFSQNAKNRAWQSPNELARQMRLNRKDTAVAGEIYYSAKFFLKNELGFNDSLRTSFYAQPALPPASKLLSVNDSLRTPQPANVEISRHRSSKSSPYVYRLSWLAAAGEGGLAPAYYVVYAFQGKHAGDMSDPSNIICVTTDTSYDLSSFLEGKHGRYSIVVTAVNRYRLESKPEEDISIRLK